MNAPIIYIGGSKGGVGKSKMSFALIEYLLRNGKKVLLIETDNANPDVYKAHQKYSDASLTCKMLNLDKADGWIHLVNEADAHPEHTLVINSAARSNRGVSSYGATLGNSLSELSRKFIALWVINRQRDSVELLHVFMDVFPNIPIHVCRNLYFGKHDKFEMYNISKIREALEAKYPSLDFPDLADRVADTLYSGRVPIIEALANLPIGSRAELRRWQQRYTEMFDVIFKESKEQE